MCDPGKALLSGLPFPDYSWGFRQLCSPPLGLRRALGDNGVSFLEHVSRENRRGKSGFIPVEQVGKAGAESDTPDSGYCLQ